MQMKMLTALFAAGAIALGAGAAPAKKDDSFGDWKLQCQKAKSGDREVCELTQFALLMDKPDAAQGDDKGERKGKLLLTVGILEAANAENPVLVMRAPLGVLLWPPPVIKVPGHKDVQVPFLRCDAKGCYSAPLGLAKEFVDAAKATEAAVAKDDKAPNGTVTLAFTVNQPGQERAQATNVTLPLSMKGFSEGLAALHAKSMVKEEPKKDDKKSSSKKGSRKK